MLYELRWRDAGSEGPFVPMPSRTFSSDGENFQTESVLMTLFWEVKEFRLFSVRVDDSAWIPVS